MALLTVAALFGWALTLMALARLRNAALCLFSGLALMVLLLYAGGLAGALRPTAHTIWFAGQGLLLFWLVQGVRNKGPLRDFLASPAPWVFAAFCTAHWLLFQDAHLVYWDEFSHWALAPKEMLHHHAIYAQNPNMSHAYYPPGAALAHYLTTLHAGFSAGALYFSQFMLLLAPFLALFQGLDLRQGGWRERVALLGWCVLASALVVFLLASLGQGVALLLVDALLGAWFGGVLLFFLAGSRSSRELLLLAAPLFVLVLVKELGLLLSLAGAGLMLLSCWLGRSRQPLERRRLLALAALLLAPLLALGSWNLRLAQQGVEQTTSARESTMQKAWRLLMEEDLAPHQETVLQRFGEVFLHQQQARSELNYRLNEFNYVVAKDFTDDWRMSAAGWASLCLGLLLLRGFLAQGARRRELLVWTLWLGGLFAVYMLMLLSLYLFIFDPGGGENLVSYSRYCNILLLPLAMLGLGVFFPLYREDVSQEGRKRGRRGLATTLLAVALTAGLYVAETPYLTPLYEAKELDFFRKELTPVLRSVKENLGARDRLFVVFPLKSNGLFRTILTYELSPIPVTISQPEVLEWPRHRLEQQMLANDYVLLLLQKNAWWQDFAPYLPQGPPQTLLYRVSQTPEGVRLAPVKTTRF